MRQNLKLISLTLKTGLYCVVGLILVMLPLEFHPWHRNDRFPCSIRKPKTRSCHLYDGHHPSSIQIFLGCITKQWCNPIFDVTIYAFDASSVVRFRSSPHSIPDTVIGAPFYMTLTTLTLHKRSSWRFSNHLQR